jgi:hypothetical protein
MNTMRVVYKGNHEFLGKIQGFSENSFKSWPQMATAIGKGV